MTAHAVLAACYTTTVLAALGTLWLLIDIRHDRRHYAKTLTA